VITTIAIPEDLKKLMDKVIIGLYITNNEFYRDAIRSKLLEIVKLNPDLLKDCEEV
jgi:metal-responsive CopG/Arc/MetJ family transcriptional regulator